MPMPTPVQPLLALLHQMRKTVERLDDTTYATPAPGRTSGGIGGHVRHCLDHISTLLGATRSGVCEYDRRRRGTEIETCRSAAVARITELAGTLAALDRSLLEDPVLVESQLEPGGAMILTRSTLCRELAFVISHTIHHNALIAQMLQARGIAVDSRYGVAPATPTDRDTSASSVETARMHAPRPFVPESLACAP